MAHGGNRGGHQAAAARPAHVGGGGGHHGGHGGGGYRGGFPGGIWGRPDFLEVEEYIPAEAEPAQDNRVIVRGINALLDDLRKRTNDRSMHLTFDLLEKMVRELA